MYNNISSTCVHKYLHGRQCTTFLCSPLGLQLISVDAMSVNASEGTQVRFACETSFSEADVMLAFGFDLPPNEALLPASSFFEVGEKGHGRSVSFIATAALNESLITCHATNKTDGNHIEVGAPALLLVQGKGVLKTKLT